MGVLAISNPKSINVLTFFLNLPLDNEEIGAALYYVVPDGNYNLMFIGAIANSRPSDIFHPGWALNPNVNVHKEIRLVIMLKSLAEIETNILVSKDTDL